MAYMAKESRKYLQQELDLLLMVINGYAGKENLQETKGPITSFGKIMPLDYDTLIFKKTNKLMIICSFSSFIIHALFENVIVIM